MPHILPLAAICGLLATTACDINPTYRVYNARKTGEAELAQADGNRQIKIQEAKASFESADYTAKAEVRKAEGMAQANAIMTASLNSPGAENYLRWKYIEMLQDNHDHQIIYIPTEAGLPVLEAGKREESK